MKMHDAAVASGYYVSSISGLATFGVTITSGQVLMMSGTVSISGGGWGLAVSGPGAWTGGSGPEFENQQATDQFQELYDGLRKEIGDYTLQNIDNIDMALMAAKRYREQGYWVHLCRVNEEAAAIYVSKWKKDDEVEKGTPKFN